MKALLLAIALMLGTPGEPFVPFTFVQMSDPQIGFFDRSAGYTQSDSLFKAAVDAVNAISPTLVVMTGDLVNAPEDAVQDSIYCVRVAELQAPVYTIPGNHDYMGFTREKQAAYIAKRGYEHFSFQQNGCAFIGMDTNCIKDGVKEAEDEQWAWLEKELAAAQGCKYTFVFVHCPVIRESMDEREDNSNFNMEQRRRYVDLFKKYGVDVVFAGHTHQEYDATVEGIRFFTAGPVGNALGHGKPGYAVVKVDENGIDATYVPTPGVKPRRMGPPSGGRPGGMPGGMPGGRPPRGDRPTGERPPFPPTR